MFSRGEDPQPPWSTSLATNNLRDLRQSLLECNSVKTRENADSQCFRSEQLVHAAGDMQTRERRNSLAGCSCRWDGNKPAHRRQRPALQNRALRVTHGWCCRGGLSICWRDSSIMHRLARPASYVLKSGTPFSGDHFRPIAILYDCHDCCCMTTYNEQKWATFFLTPSDRHQMPKVVN